MKEMLTVLGDVYLFCKGAESAILDRGISGQNARTHQHVNEFAAVRFSCYSHGRHETDFTL